MNKEEILANVHFLPVNDIIGYMLSNIVKLDELMDTGRLSSGKRVEIENTFNAIIIRIQTEWGNTIGVNTEDAYRNFNSKYPNSKYKEECDKRLNNMIWERIKSENTIDSYQKYMESCPGLHDEDCIRFIHKIEDDIDWENACIQNDEISYNQYKSKHAEGGKHLNEAEEKLRQIKINDAKRKIIIRNLKNDLNYYNASDLLEYINNKIISDEDLRKVDVDKVFIDVLNENPTFTILPNSNLLPNNLTVGYPEAFLWGAPASGKTCAIGAILSTANKEGFFKPAQCQGNNGDYMSQLTNIFLNESVCILPRSTATGNIYEMLFELHENGKYHNVCMIDLGGELFRCMYKEFNGIGLDTEQTVILNYTMDNLRNTNNRKIHFFIIEYGGENKTWEGIRMPAYLQYGASYIEKEEVFKNSTDAIYIILTKCDKIKADNEEERLSKAQNYLDEYYKAFMTTMTDTCKKYGINGGKLQTITLSVGDIFAQNLCKFKSDDSMKIIRILLNRTRAKGGLWDKIKDILGS